jgi:hypothetical protein
VKYELGSYMPEDAILYAQYGQFTLAEGQKEELFYIKFAPEWSQWAWIVFGLNGSCVATDTHQVHAVAIGMWCC